jgi:dynein heavy chain
MAKIRKEYVTNPEFDPVKVAKVSSAAEGLCKWVLAMEIYDRVIKVVIPKKEKLAQAESDLAVTMVQLNEKRTQLKAIEERLADLRQTFQNKVEEKNKLEFQVSYNWIKVTSFSRRLSCQSILMIVIYLCCF